MVISMLKIRRPLGRLIFNMGIAIPGKTFFLIETAPGVTDLCQFKETPYSNSPMIQPTWLQPICHHKIIITHPLIFSSQE